LKLAGQLFLTVSHNPDEAMTLIEFG